MTNIENVVTEEAAVENKQPQEFELSLVELDMVGGGHSAVAF